MSLEDLGNLGEFIASIGVLVTLVYLAIQIRQNTAAVKVQIRQAMSDAQLTNINLRATDPQLPLIIAKANRGETLTEEEQSRFYFHADASMRQFENTFSHYQAGVLSPADWEAQATSIRVTFRTPLSREVWDRLKGTYNQEFAAEVDRLLAGASEGGSE